MYFVDINQKSIHPSQSVYIIYIIIQHFFNKYKFAKLHFKLAKDPQLQFPAAKDRTLRSESASASSGSQCLNEGTTADYICFIHTFFFYSIAQIISLFQ